MKYDKGYINISYVLSLLKDQFVSFKRNAINTNLVTLTIQLHQLYYSET